MQTAIESEVIVGRMGGKEIWDNWTRLWNEENDLAATIIGNSFDLFLTAAVTDDPSTITNEIQVAAWIRGVREKFTAIRYSTVAGPYVDTEAQVVACAWEARGVFAGKTGLPEDQPGKTFHIMGMDILHLREGKIAGCRTISNPARPENI